MHFSRHTATTAAASALFVANAKFFLVATPSPVNGKSDAVLNDVDAGILALSPSSAPPSSAAGGRVLQSDALCTQGYVDCSYGDTSDNIPCATACYDSTSGSYKCCSGLNACADFTGRVCKDGTCSGNNACFHAKIPIVVNSCIGVTACFVVGYNPYGAGNNVGNFINSCTSFASCSQVAYGSEGGVGNLEGSCTADRACQSLGSVAEVTSNLKDCCTSDRECVDFTEIEIASQCTVSLCDRIVLYISFISCAL